MVLHQNSSSSLSDVLVIGAGAAGLAAARLLTQAGLSTTLLEARHRIGGSIHTLTETLPLPVELGPEFLHGRAPILWQLAYEQGLGLCQVQSSHRVLREGRWQAESETGTGEVWQRAEQVMALPEDSTFAHFLETEGADLPAQAKQMAIRFVEGFHASDHQRLSMHWLALEDKAEQEDGEDQLRLASGYRRVADALLRQCAPGLLTLRCGVAVRCLRWQQGQVTVELSSPEGSPLPPISARQAVVTLPLGVLQATEGPGSIRFVPPLPDKQQACQQLAMGHAARMVLHFQEEFWREAFEGNTDGLAEAGFLHTPELPVPVWWTSRPLQARYLTAWLGGPKAERLSSAAALREACLESLPQMFAMPRERIEALLLGAYTHDWSRDPFSRGAYTYVPAGGLPAVEALAAPVENTLFFAGEATCRDGRNGTVHGALQSGERAAREVLMAHRKGLQIVDGTRDKD